MNIAARIVPRKFRDRSKNPPTVLTFDQVVRRILIATMSGSLPENLRDDSIGLLLEAANCPDDDLRGLSLIGLHELGCPIVELLPVLITSLRDPVDLIRRRAVRILGEFGSVAAPAAKAVASLLRDSNYAVRLEALQTLGFIAIVPDSVIPELLQFLFEPDVRIQTIVARTIRQIGLPAIPYLLEAMQDPNAILRERVCAILGQLEKNDDRVVTALMEAMGDSEEEVREAARIALERISDYASRF